jgi:hypothetical protein
MFRFDRQLWRWQFLPLAANTRIFRFQDGLAN